MPNGGKIPETACPPCFKIITNSETIIKFCSILIDSIAVFKCDRLAFNEFRSDVTAPTTKQSFISGNTLAQIVVAPFHPWAQMKSLVNFRASMISWQERHTISWMRIIIFLRLHSHAQMYRTCSWTTRLDLSAFYYLHLFVVTTEISWIPSADLWLNVLPMPDVEQPSDYILNLNECLHRLTPGVVSSTGSIAKRWSPEIKRHFFQLTVVWKLTLRVVLKLLW